MASFTRDRSSMSFNMSMDSARAMALHRCTLDDLNSHAKSRLVRVINELVKQDPSLQSKVESILVSLVLRDELIKQQESLEHYRPPEEPEVIPHIGLLTTCLPKGIMAEPNHNLDKTFLYLARHSQFEELEIQAFYRQWNFDVGTDSQAEPVDMDIQSLKNVVAHSCQLSKKDDGASLVKMIQSVFDALNTGHISFHNFVLGLSSLMRGSRNDKLSIIFGMLDHNQTGYLTEQELTTAFRLLCKASVHITYVHSLEAPPEDRVEGLQDKAEEMAKHIFSNASETDEKGLSFQEFSMASKALLQRKHNLDSFVKAFNDAPRKAVRALLEGNWKGILDDEDGEPLGKSTGSASDSESGLVVSPEKLAQLLRCTSRLKAEALGEYLGSPHAAQQGILAAFADGWDMKGASIYDALHGFVGRFRLPGESQCIDRIMEAFSHSFMQQNPSYPVKGGADTVFVLSFSIVMLSTDLHNPNVDDKMTLDGFIKNNRGIDDGQDLPRELLEDLFKQIRKRPLKFEGIQTPIIGSMVQAIADEVLPEAVLHIHSL